ncbi:MAG: hypothetical protein ACRDKG_02760 [Actinomycetota bacterium]
MAKEICPNCDAKLTQRVSFCPNCSRPTQHASEAEHLDWDLRQWRSHVEKSVVAGSPARPPVVLGSVAVDEARTRPDPDLHVVVRPDPVVEPRRSEKGRKLRMPAIPKPDLRMPGRRRPEHEEDRVIVLDADHSFVYTACTSCERADWVVRTRRNEDDTYNYWCVRCSRSFKTDAKIRQAIKPFLTAGSIIGALATLSLVMR